MDVSVAGTDGRGQGRGLTLEEERAYRDAFAAVMVDTALGFNIFGVCTAVCVLCVVCCVRVVLACPALVEKVVCVSQDLG